MASEAIDRGLDPMAPTLQQRTSFRREDSRTDDRFDEKHDGKEAREEGTLEVEDDDPHHVMSDPFIPFDDLPEEDHYIARVRSIFIGVCCGALVNASNVYLGLKTGWTFTANLFGAIAGFAILKSLSKAVPAGTPVLGGNFGPKENNIVQTAAMAAGGMSNVFVSAIPALYQLNLLTTPAQDFWRIVSLTAVGGYFGFFFATPLRKFFIIYIARELRMIFPTPMATAMTIRSMHNALGGERLAMMKMKALSIAFSCAIVLRVVSQYAIGILWDWHFFTWFYIWGHYKNAAMAVESWGWYVEFTPAFIGAGILVGLNVSISFFMGSVLAWGIIGPALVHNGVAIGTLASDDPKWDTYYNFFSLSPARSTKIHPSPRFWMLWPGVLCMIAVSFTELFLQWRVIWLGGKAILRGTAKGIHQVSKAAGKELRWFGKKGQQDEKDIVEDIVPPKELVQMWMWIPGLILSIICVCVVLGVQYDMPVGMSLLSVFLAFFFSFLAVQCTGATDITPLTAASKASQIILGGATKGEHWAIPAAERLNLLGGAMANIGADQAQSLVSDFRTGFLLRTPPIQQWIVQGVGTAVAVFIAPLMFRLFAQAYPCILEQSPPKCEFQVPSVQAWRAVAVAVVQPDLPIPPSSGYFAIAFAVFGSIMVMIRHYLWTGRLAWMRTYHPNMMVVALAFVIPQTVYGTAQVMGSSLAYVWAKKNPRSFDTFGFAVAAGMIAGEGIGGVVNAIFQVAGISGTKYGTNIACPADSC